jgi:hypothetical protein
MAETAAVRLTNIVSVTHGTQTYKGVRSVNFNVDPGRYVPILEEGKLYPTGLENVGVPEFPVTGELVFEQSTTNLLVLQAAAAGSLVVVLSKAAGAGNETITITGCKFGRMGVSQSLQDFGRPSISFVAYSAAGTALPIAGT